MTNNEYLKSILNKYQSRDINNYTQELINLHAIIRQWAGASLLDIKVSGSNAKNTSISLSSDIDYLISLTNDAKIDAIQNSFGIIKLKRDGLPFVLYPETRDSLKEIYESLHKKLSLPYSNIRKQNVSIRINLNGLEVDITPARKYPDNTNDHNLYLSKKDTWKKTNIEKHKTDILYSSKTEEIKLLKIWRELHKLDIPSIYLEYLIIKKLLPVKKFDLEKDFLEILTKLSLSDNNVLFNTLIDPANSNNLLSDLLTYSEKQKIINQAKTSIKYDDWTKIIW